VRTLKAEMRDLVEARFRAIVGNLGTALGAKVALRYVRNYPVTRNHPAETAFAAKAAGDIVGAAQIDSEAPPVMGGEDFSYMLIERPGAYVFLGQGGGPHNCFLHNPNYDFNDEVIPLGAGYLAALVEDALPAK
jgi:hippurate hydrolase